MAMRAWWRRRDRGTEARDEIEAHIRMAVRDRIERGETPEEAERHARLEFGSVRLAIEDARAVWSWTRLEQLWMDARTGARILTHAPGLSLTAVLLIALVIGGNTTIYSAVHGMLTKPAPGVRADGLVSIAWTPGVRGVPGPEISLRHYEISRQATHLRTTAFSTRRLALTHDDGTFAVHAEAVAANYFETLGIAITHGRAFAEDEAAAGPSGLLAVVSDRFARRHFEIPESALGRGIALDGRPATIVGVAAHPFQGAWTAESTEVWVPLMADSPSDVEGIVGRLAPGSTRGEAEAELAALATLVPPGRDGAVHRPVMFEYSGTAGRNNQIARFGPLFLRIFSIVTLLTVVIVCANVANLMLGRAVARQREMAVRQSFGASRWRILRIVIAEGVTLALAAWAVASLFAYWVSHALRRALPPSQTGHVEVLLDFTPDWQVLAYALLLAMTAATAFTLVPALRMWKQDLLPHLKTGERGIVQGRSRAARGLVVVQLAFAVVLLVGAGLGYRSLSLVSNAELGFETSNLLLVTLDTAPAASTPESAAVLLSAVVDRVRSASGVTSAAVSRQTPAPSWWRVEVRTARDAEPVIAERNDVGPDYLTTLGSPLVAGTGFSAAGIPTGVSEVIVNQHLANALWPGESPLGRMLFIGRERATGTVAGVAPGVLLGGYRNDPRPPILLVRAPQPDAVGGIYTIYARYRGALDTTVPAVTRALREAAPSVPVLWVRTFGDDIESMTWTYRTLTRLLMLFAAGSLLIAVLGQYAAMAFAMRQRVRDFAIRIAMGASAKQILTSAMREGLMLTTAGLAIGVLLGSIAARAGQGLLHGVRPTDAITYGGVLIVLGAASMAACYLPARRAARVDPIEALRAE